MRTLRAWLLRFGGLFARQRRDRELADEMESHLQMHIEDNLARGMTPAEARRQALIKLGGVEQTKETYRERRGLPFLDTLLQDIRFAFRMLRKSPGFTAVAVLTLALGIGANSAIFSLVNGILLRPLPYEQPERLVALTGSSGWDDVFPEGALVAMQAKLRTMEVAGFSDTDKLNLTGVGEAMRLQGSSVSANLFSLLGARPELGRVFVKGEDQPGRDNLVILSHELWRQKFGGDPKVIGLSVALEGVNRQIVGVMPADFQLASSKSQFWVPLHLDSRNIGAYWGGGFMPVIGRLRPGVTLQQAQAEIRACIPQLRKMFPWRMPDALWADAGVIPLQESLVGNVRAKLVILLSAIALVLLIACVNVANLLLARAATRRREIGMRTAMGAGRWRICRQLLTESMLLAVCGGSLGVLLAVNGLAWLKAILPADTPRLASTAVDWRVVGFTAAVALFAGAIFGLAPALHASKVDLTQSLKTGGQQTAAMGGSRRLRNALAISEIAAAVVLVTGAGLLVKSLWKLSHVNPGFRAESIVTARVTPSEKFCAQFARCQNFYNELIAQVHALPGVEDAAVVSVLPLKLENRAFAASMEGHLQDPRQPAPVILETAITPDYLRLMGIPLLRGREFTDADAAPGAPAVALVTAATANLYWPNQDAVGKHLKPVFDKEWTTIVGVVGDIAETSLASKWPDWVTGSIYEPYGNGRGRLLPAQMSLVARTTGGESGAVAGIRNAVANLNPEAPVSDVRTLSAIVSDSIAEPRSTMSLFAIFAGLALILGAVGIYGVVSYAVVQRTAEIGMRVALGAQQRDILRLILGQGARIALAGVCTGVAGAFVATRLMTSLLFAVGASDAGTFVAVAVLLLLVALLATYIPARRATRVDPMVALRHE